jgi:hypothetical protein
MVKNDKKIKIKNKNKKIQWSVAKISGEQNDQLVHWWLLVIFGPIFKTFSDI